MAASVFVGCYIGCFLARILAFAAPDSREEGPRAQSGPGEPAKGPKNARESQDPESMEEGPRAHKTTMLEKRAVRVLTFLLLAIAAQMLMQTCSHSLGVALQ